MVLGEEWDYLQGLFVFRLQKELQIYLALRKKDKVQFVDVEVAN